MATFLGKKQNFFCKSKIQISLSSMFLTCSHILQVQGLHVGHPLGYIASDIYARYKILNGYNVLHPMGYDSFGLPTEQYAIETGIHPAKATAVNTRRYDKQLKKWALHTTGTEKY